MYIREIAGADVPQQDHGIGKVLNKGVPAGEYIVFIGLRGHHCRAGLVPQPLNEPEHLLPSLGVCLEQIFKEGDRVDDHPACFHFAYQSGEFIFNLVVGKIEIRRIEFDHIQGFVQVRGDVPAFHLHVPDNPFFALLKADIDHVLPFFQPVPDELKGEGCLSCTIRADDSTDTFWKQPPAKHIIESGNPDIDAFLAHITTRMLLTSKPPVVEILTANFTRSCSSR